MKGVAAYLNRLDFELSKILFIGYEKFRREQKQHLHQIVSQIWENEK